MSQSHSLLLQRMIHCSKSLNNFSMMPRILRKILLKYQSQPNSSNLLSKLLPNPSKLLSHPRLLQPQLSQLNLLLQFKLQLQLKHQQLRLLLLPKRLMVPQLPNRWFKEWWLRKKRKRMLSWSHSRLTSKAWTSNQPSSLSSRKFRNWLSNLRKSSTNHLPSHSLSRFLPSNKKLQISFWRLLKLLTMTSRMIKTLKLRLKKSSR